MASLFGIHFYEIPQGDGYPSYPTATLFAIKERPNDEPVAQEIGADVQRATIAILVTAAEYAALMDEWGESGSLVMDWETHNVFLAGIGDSFRVGMEDLYESSLDVIRL